MRNKRMYVTTETRFQRYMRRTWFNKLIAIGLYIVGAVLAMATIKFGEPGVDDCTFSVFLWIVATAMFFARKDFREL